MIVGWWSSCCSNGRCHVKYCQINSNTVVTFTRQILFSFFNFSKSGIRWFCPEYFTRQVCRDCRCVSVWNILPVKCAGIAGVFLPGIFYLSSVQGLQMWLCACLIKQWKLEGLNSTPAVSLAGLSVDGVSFHKASPHFPYSLASYTERRECIGVGRLLI